MKNVVTATFKTRTAAEDALEQLERAGFTPDQISMVVTDETQGKHFNIEEHSKADEGLAAGATAGGLVGAIVAGLASAGAIAIPGLNLVVSGYLISALAGLGAGAAAGGLIGALVGAGIPEHEAKLYESELRSGKILIAVDAGSRERVADAKAVFHNVDAYNVAA